MSKFIKEHIISELEDQLRGRGEVLVVDMSKLTGTDANRLRVELGQSKIETLGVKNSLARLAAGRVGLEALSPILEGPSTLVWGGDDVVALSKQITAWAKDLSALEIKGAAVEGQTLDAAGVDRLSKSPGRPELLSRIAGLILTPGGNVCGALLGAGGTIAGQIKSHGDRDE
ncbi:MAG: 50S ribosomal protein L10 [Planctomycetaceae bacterium]|jgi:large subunit ribosomal protein L10|nr:50S ribosomal protein L10 [Planctomycetaceae bacterium]